MAAKRWETSDPPKRTTKPIKLRYKDSSGRIYTGDFVWSIRENTWVECIEGPDGIGLYDDDGWKVLGWKE